MMHKTIALVILMAITLGGCSLADKPQADEAITPVQSMQSTSEKVAVFSFQDKVDDSGYLPLFTFAVAESEIANAELMPYQYTIDITCDELEDYVPQTIEVESGVRWTSENRETCISLVNIDFDAYKDIQVVTFSGLGNLTYTFYRWNRHVRKGYGEFETEPFFGLLATEYELYPDTKQLISTSRDNAINHPREMYQLYYQYKNGDWFGEYELIRTEAEDYTPDANGKVVARVFFGDEEIFQWNWTEGYDDGQRAIADHYLRFGAAKAIDLETALGLLYRKYGDKNEEYGFKYAFSFEEMMLHEKLSCYKYRLRWRPDEDHWASIGFFGVTPDGDIFDESEF